MNQPDLGIKVSELRQQKGMTQEKLAEYCDVSTRTIQRIESGEVEPRSFTRNSLSNILEFDFGREGAEGESIWLALLHLSSVACTVIIPLLLWSWKKDASLKIERQGRAVLNFQLSIMFILLGFVLLIQVIPTILMMAQNLDGNPGFLGDFLTLMPPLPILFLAVFVLYQSVVNTFRALTDQLIHYPLSIPFIK